MQNLTLNITKYIDYVLSLGLNISVHFSNEMLCRTPREIFDSFLPYNVHTNPYCMWVKKCDNHRCIKSQQSVIKSGESGIRICHGGVKEHVTHFFKNGVPVGIISVSGYRGDSASAENKALWESALSEEEIPTELVSTLTAPLAVMLEKLVESVCVNDNSEYNQILQYVNEYYTTADLDDICRHFHRSQSHVSHLFKKNSGITLRAYCNKLKLEKAEKMLIQTDHPITQIALDSGFNDVSYFINLFRQKNGISPRTYRKTLTKRFL